MKKPVKPQPLPAKARQEEVKTSPATILQGNELGIEAVDEVAKAKAMIADKSGSDPVEAGAEYPVEGDGINWKARFEALEAAIKDAASGKGQPLARDLVDPETGVPYARQGATNDAPRAVYETVKGNMRSDF